jgi:hypothetical protein
MMLSRVEEHRPDNPARDILRHAGDSVHVSLYTVFIRLKIRIDATLYQPVYRYRLQTDFFISPIRLPVRESGERWQFDLKAVYEDKSFLTNTQHIRRRYI